MLKVKNNFDINLINQYKNIDVKASKFLNGRICNGSMKYSYSLNGSDININIIYKNGKVNQIFNNDKPINGMWKIMNPCWTYHAFGIYENGFLKSGELFESISNKFKFNGRLVDKIYKSCTFEKDNLKFVFDSETCDFSRARKTGILNCSIMPHFKQSEIIFLDKDFININENNLFEFVIRNIDNIRIFKATSEHCYGKYKCNININNLALKCHVIDTVSKKKVGNNYYDALKFCPKDNFTNSIKFYICNIKEKNKIKELKEYVEKLNKKRSIEDSKESKSKKKARNSKEAGSSSSKI
jgi:hypothetical protein